MRYKNLVCIVICINIPIWIRDFHSVLIEFEFFFSPNCSIFFFLNVHKKLKKKLK